MTENVLLEVQKTFDFFKTTASTDRIDRIMLQRRRRRASRALRRRCRSGSARRSRCSIPFRQVALDAQEVLRAEQRETITPTAAVAVGLALRRAGDR